MVVGPGEGDRYLEATLKQLWVDDICLVLNNADPKTIQIAEKYAQLVVHDNREWGKEQWRIKQDFLKKVVEFCNPDWIWCLDSDEIFDPAFTREKAEELTRGNDIAWYFWCLQLWNEPGKVRLDLSFPNVRFYKVMPEWGLHFKTAALHCGLAPMYAYQWGSQSNLYFKHYGLMLPADRVKKVARYDKYDPTAKYKGKDWYSALRNEKARSVPFEDAVSQLPDIIYKDKVIKKPMSKNKEIFMFRNKHGKVVPAQGLAQRDQFIKMGFAELSNIQVNPNPEAPVVKAPVETPATEYKTDEVPKTEYTEGPSEAPAKPVKPKAKSRAKSNKTV